MSDSMRDQLRAIKTFSSLVRYLRDELDWPIEAGDFEDLTFDYEPEELGIDPSTAAKISEIKQLRPLVTNQPWGIFFLKFEPKRLPIVVLRRILSKLVLRCVNQRYDTCPQIIYFHSQYITRILTQLSTSNKKKSLSQKIRTSCLELA